MMNDKKTKAMVVNGAKAPSMMSKEAFLIGEEE
jgi:hypothetical protein